jgi:hypothetical protein
MFVKIIILFNLPNLFICRYLHQTRFCILVNLKIIYVFFFSNIFFFEVKKKPDDDWP